MSIADLPAASRHRVVALIFVSTFVNLVGFFMLLPLLVVRLSERGLQPAVVGLFSATMWLGIFVATPFAARFVAHVGRRRAFVVTAALPLLAAWGFVFTESLTAWFGLILVDGMASGIRWVLSEATVAEAAPAQRRGLIVGLFETMVGATFVVGPTLLQFTGTQGSLAFVAAAVLCTLGFALTLLLPQLPASDHAAQTTTNSLQGLLTAARNCTAAMAAGCVGGFFESGTAGLLPLMGLSMGWLAATAALLVAASGLGSALAMTPAGWLADRIGAAQVQRACAWMTLMGCLALPAAGHWPPLAWGIAFIWGGAGGALYTLAMIDIGHRLKGVDLIQTTGVLVMSYTLGGMLAPPTGGLAMQLAPQWGLPIWMSLVAGLGLWALRRKPEFDAPASSEVHQKQ